MALARTIAIVVILGLVAVDRPRAAGAWTEVRTPHYLFIGDASPGDMRPIAQRFEQFHGVMQRLLSRAALSFSVPTVVIVFRNADSFRPYLPLYEGKPKDVSGMAWSGGELSYVAINAAGGDQAYSTVFHELTHLITANVSYSYATWFSEGIAEYYSSFEMRGAKQVLLGKPLAHHAATLQQQFIPLRELINADQSSKIYNESDRATVFYAESWALVHFLRGNDLTRDRFDEYMKLAERGTTQQQAFKEAFGMELPALEKALRSYVRLFRVPGEVWTLADTVADGGMSVSPLDEANALVHLANVLIRMDRLEEAEKRLQAVLAKTPSSAAALAALTLLRLEQNRPADASTALNRDVAYSGFMDHYLAAIALARYISAVDPRSPEGSAAVSKLRDRLRAATAERTDVPEAWRLLAWAYLLSDDTDQAANAIDRALVLAPANERYRFTLADVLVRQRDFSRARATLGLLMAHGRTPDVRDNARRMMVSVVEYERASTPQSAGSNEPAEDDNSNAEPAQPQDDATTSSTKRQKDTFVPAWRRTEPGEVRVFGRLVAIECGAAGVTLVLRLGARALRITASSFERIDFISYRDDLKGQVTCAPRTPPDIVYVTWRGQDTGGSEIRTEAVAVEFTPRGYTP